jgi:hypothetical protein
VLAQPKLSKQNFYSQNYFSENSKPAAPPSSIFGFTQFSSFT